MITIATILSGGEGVGVGAKTAGLHHLWGIEIDDKIAQVARDNNFHMTNATSSHPETRGTGVLAPSQPANTVCAGGIGGRGFIVGGQFGKPDDGSGEDRPPQTRDEGEPVFTVTAQNKGDWRAWLSRGRVVKMTPRALARFQSFPDSYILPDSNTLACKVIGNAVPPLMYQKIVRGLVR